MASKQFVLEQGTEVTIYKRRTNRNIRLTIASNGQVRVSIPSWAPYSAGLRFAKQRESWIESQKQPTNVLKDGDMIGKAHRLRLIAGNVEKPQSRLVQNEVRITYPQVMDFKDLKVQECARKTGIKALRQQAEQLLPKRLEQLAQEHNFVYRSVAIKQLRGRWGSCDAQKHIVLNLFLMQLDWKYIDYVLLHELVHTEVLRHGPDFWAAFESVVPHAKQLKREIAGYQPVLRGL